MAAAAGGWAGRADREPLPHSPDLPFSQPHTVRFTCCPHATCCEQVKQAAEAAARAAAKAAKGDAPSALEDDASEETDPTKYYENRVKSIIAAKERGENPYPHK